MKKILVDSAVLIFVISFIATMTATSTNACDRNKVMQGCIYKKPIKKTPFVSKTPSEYPDFILTNTIFRF